MAITKVSNSVLNLSGNTDAVGLPKGTEAQRPTPVAGMLRFNTDTGEFEGYDGTDWDVIPGLNSANKQLLIKPQNLGKVISVTESIVDDTTVFSDDVAYQFFLYSETEGEFYLGNDNFLNYFPDGIVPLEHIFTLVVGEESVSFSITSEMFPGGYSISIISASDNFDPYSAYSNSPDGGVVVDSFYFGTSYEIDVIEVENNKPIDGNIEYLISSLENSIKKDIIFLESPELQVVFQGTNYNPSFENVRFFELQQDIEWVIGEKYNFTFESNGNQYTAEVIASTKYLAYVDEETQISQWYYEYAPTEENPDWFYNDLNHISFAKPATASVDSIEVMENSTIISTTAKGAFSVDEDVYLHQSLGKIQVVDQNGETIDLISYDVSTGITTSNLSSYIDVTEAGSIVSKDLKNAIKNKSSLPLIGISTPSVSFDESVSAEGSILLIGGRQEGSNFNENITNSIYIDKQPSYQNLGFDNGIVIGSNLNMPNNPANFVSIGNNSGFDESYTADMIDYPLSPTRSVMIGSECRTQRGASVAIGYNIQTRDYGSNSINRPYTFQYNLVRSGSTQSLTSGTDLYIAKWNGGYGGSWTTIMPVLTNTGHLKYFFSPYTINGLTNYTNSCMRVHVSGIFKDLEAGIPIETDKKFLYFGNGSSWQLHSEVESSGSPNWSTNITFQGDHDFVISIQNQSGSTRSVRGANLNVEVTFTR